MTKFKKKMQKTQKKYFLKLWIAMVAVCIQNRNKFTFYIDLIYKQYISLKANKAKQNTINTKPSNISSFPHYCHNNKNKSDSHLMLLLFRCISLTRKKVKLVLTGIAIKTWIIQASQSYWS